MMSVRIVEIDALLQLEMFVTQVQVGGLLGTLVTAQVEETPAIPRPTPFGAVTMRVRRCRLRSRLALIGGGQRIQPAGGRGHLEDRAPVAVGGGAATGGGPAVARADRPCPYSVGHASLEIADEQLDVDRTEVARTQEDQGDVETGGAQLRTTRVGVRISGDHAAVIGRAASAAPGPLSAPSFETQ